MEQNKFDVVGFGCGVLLLIGSLTAWINIGIISVASTRTWWGFVTIVGALLLLAYFSSQLWPNVLDQKLVPLLKKLVVVGLVASLGVVAYVGVRLTDASREFNEATSTDSGDVDTSVLGSEFQDALDEFEESLKDAFRPSLGLGWYLSAISTVGGLVVVLKKRDEVTTSTTDAVS